MRNIQQQTLAQFPSKYINASLLLSLTLFGILGLNMFNMFKALQSISYYDIRITELTGRILHYDEVLTMSARMAATTGDLTWKERYYEYESKLDHSIKTATQLAKAVGYGFKSVEQTDSANQKLIDMEVQAFAFVETGELKKAQNILFTNEYITQKKIYLDGMVAINDHLDHMIDKRLESETNKALISAIFIGITLVALFILWAFTLRAIDAWRHTSQTMRDEAEEINHELENTVENLRKANSELERFNYASAHDLKEPLRTIYSFSQLLEEEIPKKQSTAHDYLVSIQKANLKMRDLIDGLLNYTKLSYSRIQRNNVDCEDIVRLVQNDILASQIKENEAIINIKELPVIKAEKTQMIQIFQNLISNAIKYRSEEAPIVNISATNSEKNWLFKVADNGIGVDQEYREKIFTLFSKLHDKRKYPGTGVGLAICKKAIESLGGEIWVESNNGQGSVFCFTIPNQSKNNNDA